MWTKTTPQPLPKNLGSLWYWYWEEGYKEPWITEVKSGSWKLTNYKGWWSTEPIPKPKKPTIQHTLGVSRKKVNKLSKIDERRLELELALSILESQKDEN